MTATPITPAARASVPRRRRWPAAVLLAAAAVVAAGVVTAEVVLSEPAPPTPEAVEVAPGTVGHRYCPVTASAEESATVTVAAVGAEPSEVVLTHHGPDEGSATEEEARTLRPGERQEIDVRADQPLSVRWRGGQVQAAWTVEGERTASGLCPDAAVPAAYYAGLDTSLGSQATVHVLNPFTVDAVVRLRYATEEGPATLVSTDNVAVQAGHSQAIDLTELLPEEPRLGVVVETVTGRVVSQAEVERVRVDEEDDGPQGRALVAATPAPAPTAWFAYATDSRLWDSTLVLHNPGDRATTVRVRPSDPLEGAGAVEATVPAGGVAELELGGLAEPQTFAFVAESTDGSAFVAARRETIASEPPSVAIPAAKVRTATRWATPGVAGERADLVSVHNPGPEVATVQMTADGEPVTGWDGRSLGANERAFADLRDGGAPPVIAESDEPVVVELVSFLTAGDDRSRVVGLSEPVPLPAAAVRVPAVRRHPELATTPVEPVDPEADPFDDAAEPERAEAEDGGA